MLHIFLSQSQGCYRTPFHTDPDYHSYVLKTLDCCSTYDSMTIEDTDITGAPNKHCYSMTALEFFQTNTTTVLTRARLPGFFRVIFGTEGATWFESNFLACCSKQAASKDSWFQRTVLGWRSSEILLPLLTAC